MYGAIVTSFGPVNCSVVLKFGYMAVSALLAQLNWTACCLS